MKLVWFRRDLRIGDNPALYEACQAGTGVIGLHITTLKTWQSHNMASVQQKWLSLNIDSLQNSLHKINVPLIQTETNFFSSCDELILNLIKKHNITEIYFNLEYEWDERRRDQKVIQKLQSAKIAVHTFHDQCIIQPDTILNQQGNPYLVFTPFKKNYLNHINFDPSILFPYNTPSCQKKMPIEPYNDCSQNTTIVQDISWLKVGSEQALIKLQTFIDEKVDSYDKHRDIPNIYGTSCISAYLAIGVISAKQCINVLLNSTEHNCVDGIIENKGAMIWFSELIWRDFYKMICFNFPHVSRSKPFKVKTDNLIWSDNKAHLKAWQQGKTGVPIVDAAMRQLNTYGWMHNRLRMVSAMYLTKNLWLDWREGESYFASKLVDWDFASNNGGWQWCASTGTDAAPYFRVFNPVSQSERFDPKGEFIRQYCPELKDLNDKQIHYPFERGITKLNYPKPLIDLKTSRAHAIENFKSL